MDERYIIAIETGSSKIKGAIGTIENGDILSVKAVEEQPLIDAVRNGLVNNITSTANATKNILKKIENRVSPRKVEGVYVAVGGRSVMSYRLEVERRLMPETEITSTLIEQLKNETLSKGVPGKEILQVVPIEYIVDNKRVHNPIGVYGSDIKMVSNLIACRPQLKRNLDLLVTDKLGLKIEGYVVRQIAQADLVLTPEEKRLGCMFVDLGAETTTVSIYKHGALQYLVTIPIGSRNITHDITTLNHLEEDAEAIKKQRGHAGKKSNSGVDNVEFSEINNLIHHRAAEIIANINQQLKPDENIGYAGFKPSELPAGVIIVGRGAKLTDFNTLLGKMLEMNVRAGSLISHSVRIAAGSINPADAIDVISILYGAIALGAHECLSKPVVEETVETEPVEVDDFEEEEPRGWKSKGFFTKLGKKIGNFLTEPEEDQEEEDF